MSDSKKMCGCCPEGCTCGDCACCSANANAKAAECCSSMKSCCSGSTCGNWWKWLLGAVLLLLTFGAGAMFGSHKGGKYGRGDFGGGCPMMQKMHGGMKGEMKGDMKEGGGCGMMKDSWSITSGQVVGMTGEVKTGTGVGTGN